MSLRAAELKQEFIEVLIKHRPRVHGESSAAGIKIIKHGIKRIMILLYFILRKMAISFRIISP